MAGRARQPTDHAQAGVTRETRERPPETWHKAPHLPNVIWNAILQSW